MLTSVKLKGSYSALRIVTLIILFLSSTIMVVYGIGMLGFHGAGLIILWPGVLCLLYSIGVKIRAGWEIHLSILLINVLFILYVATWYGANLTCLYPETAQNYCSDEQPFITLLLVVAVSAIILIRFVYKTNISVRDFVGYIYSPIVLFAFAWSVAVGFITLQML